MRLSCVDMPIVEDWQAEVNLGVQICLFDLRKNERCPTLAQMIRAYVTRVHVEIRFVTP